MGVNLQKQNRHGIRKSYNKGKTEYIDNASSVYSVEGNCDKYKIDEKLSEVWTEDFEWIEIVTGLQSFLQILLEYLVVMDRIFVLSIAMLLYLLSKIQNQLKIVYERIYDYIC